MTDIEKGKEVVEDIGVYVYDEEEWLKDHDDCLPEKYLLKFDEARALLIHFAALEAQLKAAEARVKELEQGFREVLVCARNISEGYYEDAALLGRIARSFLLQVEKSPLHSGHDQPSRSFDQ